MRRFSLLISAGCVWLLPWLPTPAHAGTNLTTTIVEAGGTDWTAAIWKTNGTGTSVAPVAGNTYETVFNGTSIGNGLNNTRIRNPAAAGLQTFPGNSLMLDTNTELRTKGVGAILNFPGVGGNPGLILNGGMLNGGDDTTFAITGKVQVASQSYISHGVNGGGGGIAPNRAFNFTGLLTGTGNIVILNAGTTIPQRVSGSSNAFSGGWIVQCGWLLGSATNSLGTNNVTVDPLYAGYLTAMPKFVASNSAAWFEVGYDLNSAGRLILTNGGVMMLHQNCIFSSVIIQGAALSAGTHYYAELAANFPNNFAAGGSGSLTVQPYGPPPQFAPQITTQPLSAAVYTGSPTQFVATASGTSPLYYQWQKGTNAAYVNLTDAGDVSGSKTNILVFNAVVPGDAADYRLIVTNAVGAATSQVATLTVLFTDTNRPAITALNPPAGATVSTLTQIQVTFSKTVIGVDAEDLQINGAPAGFLSGSGSNYLFSFSQPPAGTVQITWDVDSGISDLSGNPFDPSVSWTYRLLDNIPPILASTVPAAAATVDRLAQAQVFFSKAVSGVDAADLLVNGLPATNVSGSGFGPYTFQFAQPAQGVVQFSWAAGHNIRDSASNLFGGTGWSVTLDPAAASALTNLVINEILAANVSTDGLADEDGQLSDWLELYNRGVAPVNLGGWSLTDSTDQPAQWTFPATNIAPSQYLVVFASGKDRRTPGANLHTNFKLSSVGGYLGLYSSDFPPQVVHEYAPGYPEQRNDISYGLDGANSQKYFAVQTPGGPNSSNTLAGLVAPVHLSVQHGFFNQPFNLVLTTETPGATILYTTDGSEPGISGGLTNGTLYTGSINISRTTAVRAAAFVPGLLPTLVASQTYLFVEDIVRQPNNPPGYPTGYVWTPTPGEVSTGTLADYQMDPAIVNDAQYSNAVRAGLVAIPAMSVVTPIDDLFGPANGIYTRSADHTLEVPASMELIYPDGTPGRQADCGLQMQGGASRLPERTPKHSFRVDFKSGYGPKELDYQVFGDSPVASFKTLVLDAGYNFWWHYGGGANPDDQRYRAQCVRDQFISDLMLALDHPSFHGQFYHLYLNGLYWGLHYIHERPDDDFAASYFGGDNSDYDVIKNTSDNLQVVAGDLTAWNAMLALANSGLANNAQYLQLQQYVDLDNLIDYMIVNHWGGNDDWPQHNWYVLRNRTTGGTFKFMMWDAEQVLKSVTENVTTVNAASSPAQVYNALRNNAEFRLLFADHLQRLFFNGGLFYTDPNPANARWDAAHPERNVPASYYMKRINEITNAIVDESARWGTYFLTNYTRNNQWLLELNNLLGFTNTAANTANYFPQRSANVLNQYKAIGLFPSVSAPLFSQLGGNVPFGYALTMTNPNSGGKIYYTTNNTDPRTFGSGAVALGTLVYSNTPLVLNDGNVVKARVLNGSWSALAEGDFSVALLGVPIRITELMYNPIGGKAYEFIELENLGALTVDLSGYSFEGVTDVFPDGTSLGPGGVMVIASGVNPGAWAGRYPGVAVAGYFGDALDNAGERIALLDRNGSTVTSVTYSPGDGWPTAADGGGYSLEVINPKGDPNDPANWRASAAVNGSPGIVTTSASSPVVRFNEIMAENAGAVPNGGTWPDWLELYNPGSNAVSLANWSLSKSGDARQFVFPGGTAIPAGGFLVVWCDGQTSAPGLHSGFNLGHKGESLFLYDANTNRIDAFSFGLQLTDYSVGRIDPDGPWQLTLPTPGSNNVAAAVGGATNLVLNEWLANSVSGGSDWIELYNLSSNLPVALAGLYLATSNELFEIGSLSFIAPRGFVQLFADNSPGFDHLDFKLSAAGDAIMLYDYLGQPIDRVSFVNQVEGVSQGRFPDGSANIVGFPGTASPVASNYVSSYTGPILNELMARNVATVYDARGNNPDWIELYNPNAASYSLAGMSLSADPGSPGQWVFPAGSSIGSNSYLIVWCDASRPASTNLEAQLNAGFTLSGDGAAVYLFNTNNQVADSVAFGFQVTDLSMGRSGGTWSLLSNPSPGAVNASPVPLGDPANLRINEWMANPVSGNDWFELYNTDSSPVSLAGLYLTDDPSIAGATNFQVPALSFIASQGWVRFEADSHRSHGPNHVNFSLDKEGQTLRLYHTNLALLDSIEFGLQASGVSQGRLPDGGSDIVSFSTTPTPGESSYLPLQNVVVNEVLSHTDPPLEDAIELYNPTSNDVPLGGWFISNAETDFKKYRIPDGTVLPAGGYKVFYEDQFNSSNATPFTLNSAHGDSVLVSAADGAGNLSGYRSQISFGAAQNGVSLGGFQTSAGVDFVTLSSRTFGVDHPATLTQFRTGTGLTNSYPLVGPVVVNEIMYHPITGSGTNAFENTDEEFIELLNITSNTVPLYDLAAATNHWKLAGGIDYSFPAGVSLPPGGLLLVVGFDPTVNLAALANFRLKYALASDAVIYGPYDGNLNNAGESIQLYKPDSPQTLPHPDAGFVPYVLVEQVIYSNAPPWPAGADGTGMSLQRRLLGSYGNEPLNWMACSPTPGTRNCMSDTDGDGLPDDWELANGLNPSSAVGNDGTNGDPDGDGLTNLQEYLAGTDPHDPASFLKIDSIGLLPGVAALRFTRVASHSYSIQYRTSVATGSWQKLADVESAPTTAAVQVNDLSAGGATSRFYRLVTPKQP
jgi:hypothetical protein